MFQEHCQKIFPHIHCLHLMHSDVSWVLVFLGTQVWPQIMLDQDYSLLWLCCHNFSVHIKQSLPTNWPPFYWIWLLQITKMFKLLLLKFFPIHTVQQSNKHFNQNPTRCAAALIDLLFLKSCLFVRFKIALFEITRELCCTLGNKLFG